jgi:hypothetical protein
LQLYSTETSTRLNATKPHNAPGQSQHASPNTKLPAARVVLKALLTGQFSTLNIQINDSYLNELVESRIMQARNEFRKAQMGEPSDKEVLGYHGVRD